MKRLLILFFTLALGMGSFSYPMFVYAQQGNDEFKTPSADEFKSVDKNEFKSVDKNEFKSVDKNEFKKETKGSKSENKKDNEFKEASSDEFVSKEEFTKISESKTGGCSGCSGCPSKTETIIDYRPLYEVLWILAFAVLAGVFVRFKFTRNLRNVFLLSSLIYLGFYKYGCPCMISSFEDFVLLFTGNYTSWFNYVWFLGLIPITYIFGRVWCGWVCHLGALQEFIHLPAKFNVFSGYKAQRIMRYLSYVLTLALILQIIIQKKIFWCSIDPFVPIFTMNFKYDYTLMNYILIGTLIITSLFSYRPFCRAACPVGLVLSWISLVPGASIIGVNNHSCTSCKSCNSACKIDAITRNNKLSKIDNKECIVCGDCLDSCNITSLSFVRNCKSKGNTVIVECKKDCV
ncbi:MAG: 4Fe-4S binding protein [Bacteroidota bacterium]